MIRIILSFVVAWLAGVFGWSQIIGSLQNIRMRPSLVVALIVWLIIMSAIAYFAIAKFDCLWPLVAGYVLSFLQTIRAGKIS